MDTPGEAARLRIYLGDNDVFGDRPLCDALVFKAREMGLAGATALRGIMGFGQKTVPRSTELILSRDLPIVVEVVDSRDRIEQYYQAVEPMLRAGLATIETITVLRHGGASAGAEGTAPQC